MGYRPSLTVWLEEYVGPLNKYFFQKKAYYVFSEDDIGIGDDGFWREVDNTWGQLRSKDYEEYMERGQWTGKRVWSGDERLDQVNIATVHDFFVKGNYGSLEFPFIQFENPCSKIKEWLIAHPKVDTRLFRIILFMQDDTP